MMLKRRYFILAARAILVMLGMCIGIASLDIVITSISQAGETKFWFLLWGGGASVLCCLAALYLLTTDGE